MKLRYSPTSPYTRKVSVVAIETGLDEKIERVVTNVSDPASDISKDNPLGKIPALVTDDGQVLYDSPVICEYLDILGGGMKLFPKPSPRRWTALRRQALADGIMDAAILRMVEGRRPASQQSEEWKARQKKKMEQALDALESEADGLDGPIDIGHVAVGCALEYVDFRFAGEDWRKSRPRLTAWQKKFAARPSMAATVPKEMKA